MRTELVEAVRVLVRPHSVGEAAIVPLGAFPRHVSVVPLPPQAPEIMP